MAKYGPRSARTIQPATTASSAAPMPAAIVPSAKPVKYCAWVKTMWVVRAPEVNMPTS